MTSACVAFFSESDVVDGMQLGAARKGGNVRGESVRGACSTLRCDTYAGIQGHALYMDACGDTEANYTVLALYTNHGVNRTDIERRRTMRPVGHFHTAELASPVGASAIKLTRTYNIQQEA